MNNKLTLAKQNAVPGELVTKYSKASELVYK